MIFPLCIVNKYSIPHSYRAAGDHKHFYRYMYSIYDGKCLNFSRPERFKLAHFNFFHVLRVQYTLVAIYRGRIHIPPPPLPPSLPPMAGICN